MKIGRLPFIRTLLALPFVLSTAAKAAIRRPSPKVMLGIDVLESMNFAQISGKRVGLLTHPAGVNR